MVKASAVKRKSTAVKLPGSGDASKHDQLRDLRSRLVDALRAAGHLPKPKKDEWVRGEVEDIYNNTVVFYENYDNLFACNYTDKNGVITLTKPVPVVRRTIYVPK